MYIHEAITEAQKRPSVIRRPDFGRFFILVPQNPKEVLYGGVNGSPTPIMGWEPTGEDLTADDWEVSRAEGIEWPEPAPIAIQRTWVRFLRSFLP